MTHQPGVYVPLRALFLVGIVMQHLMILHHGKVSNFAKGGKLIADLSLVMRKPTFWFSTRSDTNQAVQLQKMTRGLKLESRGIVLSM